MHVLKEAGGVTVEVLEGRASQQGRAHFVCDGSLKAAFTHGLEEGGVVYEAFVHGDGLGAGGKFLVVDDRGQIPELGAHGVIGHRGVNRQRAEFAGGALDVEALQRGRPGIEHGAAMIVIDLAHQIVEAVGIHRDVMVILYADDHIEFGGAIGGFP